MTFHSILWQRPEEAFAGKAPEAPACFVDLNLDQIVEDLTSGREEYELKSSFYVPLRDPSTVAYRQEVMRDLDDPSLLANIKSFAEAMRTMRRCLAQSNRLQNEYQKQRWFLDGVQAYCDAIANLEGALAAAQLRSRGLRSFQDFLMTYTHSGPFASLVQDTARLKGDLSSIRYSLFVSDRAVTVRRSEPEADYASEIEKTFQAFKQGAQTDYRVSFRQTPKLNSVEEKVLEFVTRLYPDTFKALAAYCEIHHAYLDDSVGSFDREIQFFVAYLDHISAYQAKGLSFCYPTISADSKNVYDFDCFDVALAKRLHTMDAPIVCNDFYLKEQERILVVSGPNQGGKTTFARTFGQVHYLASLGLPVPGKEARLFLFDNLFTLFEKGEDLATLRGALQDSLVRIHDILRGGTSRSIIITNELFASATLQDALFLGSKVLEEVIKLDALCVYVTFVEELASLSAKTVSMVSTVVPNNPAVRTYKVVRKAADGRAWAISIAEKYGLTYQRLMERLDP